MSKKPREIKDRDDGGWRRWFRRRKDEAELAPTQEPVGPGEVRSGTRWLCIVPGCEWRHEESDDPTREEIEVLRANEVHETVIELMTNRAIRTEREIAAHLLEAHAAFVAEAIRTFMTGL